MSSPCHIEMILTEKEQIVPKPEEEVAQKKKVTRGAFPAGVQDPESGDEVFLGQEGCCEDLP